MSSNAKQLILENKVFFAPIEHFSDKEKCLNVFDEMLSTSRLTKDISWIHGLFYSNNKINHLQCVTASHQPSGDKNI